MTERSLTPRKVPENPDARPVETVELPQPSAVPAGTPCAWFAACNRDATHLEPHPILGAVPACDRCPTIGQ